MNIYDTIIISLIILLLAISSIAFCQPTNNFHDTNEIKKHHLAHYYVRTKDNTLFTGVMINHNRKEAEMTFQLYGYYNVVVLRSNIKSLRRLKPSEIKDGNYIYPDPNQSRFLTQPTSFGMKAGQWQYKTTNIVYQSLHYGLTNNVSLHIGSEFYTTFIQNKPSYHLGATANIPIHRIIRLSANVSFANITDQFEKIVTAQGAITFGNVHQNVNVGYGYGYPTLRADFNSPTQFLTANFKYRFNRRFALISENWYFLNFDEEKNLQHTVSLGGRLMFDNLAFDVAIVHNKEFRELLPIGLPVASLTYTFK